MKKNIIFIIAGEKSGDKLGAQLITDMKQKDPNLSFIGVGGTLMKDCGVVSLFEMEELSVMGIIEILPRLHKLISIKNKLINEILSCEPCCLITIDSPDFCLRVARKVKLLKPKIKTIHYVAPSLWAWRSYRGLKIAKFIDHILTLFPFEPDYLQSYGISSTYVGHPVSLMKRHHEIEKKSFKANIGVISPKKLLILLPGSRASEVRRILPVFLKAIKLASIELSDLKIIIPAPLEVKDIVEKIIRASGIDIEVIFEKPSNASNFELLKSQVFASADFAIAASGTVTLELAAHNIPMVVGYDVNWVSRLIIRSLIKIKYVSPVNIILNRELVPELVGSNFKANLISEKIINLINNDFMRSEQKIGLSELMSVLRGDDKETARNAGLTVYRLLKNWKLI